MFINNLANGQQNEFNIFANKGSTVYKSKNNYIRTLHYDMDPDGTMPRI